MDDASHLRSRSTLDKQQLDEVQPLTRFCFAILYHIR